MRSTPIRMLALTLSLVFGLSACGGSSDLDDLAETLAEVGDLTTEQAACVAAELRESGAYDEDEVNDFADGQTDDPARAEKLAAFENDVAGAVSNCGGG